MLYKVNNQMLIGLGFDAKLNEYEGATLRLMTIEQLKDFSEKHPDFSVIDVEGKVIKCQDVVFEDIGDGFTRYGLLG